MAHGMRQGILSSPARGTGNEDENEGAACGDKANLANVVALVNTKCTTDLIECTLLLNASNVGVHVADVVEVRKYKRLFRVKADGDNILQLQKKENVLKMQR